MRSVTGTVGVMEWTADVAAGAWIRDRIDDPWRGTMHDVVPRGFPFYTRVFHGTTRSRPVEGEWPPLPHDKNRRAWEEFSRREVEIEATAANWADAAESFGTEMHGGAQWGSLVRARSRDWDPNAWQQAQSADGWQFDAPQEGQLDAATLSAVAGVAAAHTTTPDDGFVALWEGWGGLVGAMGYGPSRALLTAVNEPDAADAQTGHHLEFLARSTRDVFNDVFRRPTWQPGILSDEISRGPRLSLPNRDFVLFRAAMSELADPDWVRTVPWRDRVGDDHGFPPRAESPSIVWPADRAWVMVSEVDWDSTIVAGSSELQHALCTDPRLEALGIREGASLQWDADEVNR